MLLYSFTAGPTLMFRIDKMSFWLRDSRASPSICSRLNKLVSFSQHGKLEIKSTTSLFDHDRGSMSVLMYFLRKCECLCHDSLSAGRIFDCSMSSIAFCSLVSEMGELSSFFSFFRGFFSGGSSAGAGFGCSRRRYFGGLPKRGLLQQNIYYYIGSNKRLLIKDS